MPNPIMIDVSKEPEWRICEMIRWLEAELEWRGDPRGTPDLHRHATTQELQLELIRRTSFNAFDGPRIHRDLLAHRNLWRAVLLDGAGKNDLVRLRDLPDDQWNANTLRISTPDRPNAYAIEDLAQRWEPDTVDVLEGSAAQFALGSSYAQECVVTLWWD